MKQSFLIITLCLFSFVSLATPITSATDIEVDPTGSFELGCTGLQGKDEIDFTTTNSIIGPFEHLSTIIVPDGAICPFKGTANFGTAGIYSIIVTRAIGATIEVVMQTPKQYVAEKITANSLTAIEGKPLVNVPIEIKLTFAPKTILRSDIIILSADASGKEVTMKTYDFNSGVVILNSITFTEEDTYQVILRRKNSQSLQSGANLKLIVVRPKVPDIFDTPDPLYANGQAQTVKLSFTEGVVVNDIITITSKETVDSSAIVTPITAIQSPISTKAHAYTVGLYNIFITSKEADSLPVKQNAKLIVFAQTIDETIITAITGTDVKANKAAIIKLTYSKNTLYDGDQLILSLSTGASVSDTADDNLEVVLSNIDFTKAEHTQSVTFKKEGTYSVWIKRGTDASVKQTGTLANIIVAMAGYWIRISFVILIGLLAL